VFDTLIPVAATVIVALVEALAAMDRKRDKDLRRRTERREEDRAREGRLAMLMMDASLELSLATAIAVEQQKSNGEMKTAKQKAEEAQEKYREFIMEIAARPVAKM